MSDLSSENEGGSDLRHVISTQESTSVDGGASVGMTKDSDAIGKIISELIGRRARGEQISNEEIIALHPELMPDLRDELFAAGQIHKVVLLGQGQHASPLSTDRSRESVSAWAKNPETIQSEDDPHRGLRLHGYLIEREISSGGQAIVFKALQERTNRDVAIKLMHGGPFMSSRGRSRFERESKILASLNHPNLVTILDRGRTPDGSFFLVMDFIDGRSLDQFVRESAKDMSSVVRLFVKIASAIDHAHQRGVVHRDLKPMNILVDCRGEPHIVDFGMARCIRERGDEEENGYPVDITRTGQLLGTLPWASPEQISASPDAIDARSDVYALGVMLFASLAGQFPYPIDGDLCSVTHHITNTPPASLTRLARRNGLRVSHTLEAVVLKALCKIPRDRHESAGKLARDLNEWLEGKSRPVRQLATKLLRWSLVIGLLFAFALISVDHRPAVNPKPYFTNSVGMHFVRIPPDGQRLPVPANDRQEIDFYQPAADITAKIFYISTTVVTQEEFLRVTGRNPSEPSKPDFPVERVTWDEAVQFCNALSAREHRKYRLPTVAEWKMAWLLGKSSTLNQNTLDFAAWYAGDSGYHLHAVAKKAPDRLGLYDMIGDVREWCSFSVVRRSSMTAHIDVNADDVHPAEGTDYMMPATDCLSPSKLQGEYPPKSAQPFIGFRVVCESSNPN
jgi:serine/threonine protein kinase